MASTGPLFLSLRWKEWLDMGKGDATNSVVAFRRDERKYGYRDFSLTLKGGAGRVQMRGISPSWKEIGLWI
jgi:hypothetical protein